uniref:SFRICE_026544 n=1 Tax=Spodoptera frugiperda TaxID=7108 RepID=A0A2H1VNK9_SPOFR
MTLNSAQVAQAVLFRSQRRTQREIAETLDVPRTTLRFALKRYDQTGLYTRRPESGGFRCSSARDDRFMVLAILKNRFLTAVEIRQRLQTARGVNVSERTVRKRMEEQNLSARRPARGPELLRHHRVARLRFAREHANWTHEQWSKVLWTDGCRVALRAPNGRELVWRTHWESQTASEQRVLVNIILVNVKSIPRTCAGAVCIPKGQCGTTVSVHHARDALISDTCGNLPQLVTHDRCQRGHDELVVFVFHNNDAMTKNVTNMTRRLMGTD